MKTKLKHMIGEMRPKHVVPGGFCNVKPTRDSFAKTNFNSGGMKREIIEAANKVLTRGFYDAYGR